MIQQFFLYLCKYGQPIFLNLSKDWTDTRISQLKYLDYNSGISLMDYTECASTIEHTTKNIIL